MDKNEEDLIMQGRVEPDEWKKEVERLTVELDNIEKEIELRRTRGIDMNSNEQDFEEGRKHIEMIVELCRDIRETCH